MDDVVRGRKTKVKVRFRTAEGYKTKTVTTELLTNKYTAILFQPMFKEVEQQIRKSQGNIISFLWFQHLGEGIQ